jgi:hypothetical protein
MPTLRFEGYSDDTFGEYGFTDDDYDNFASGKPIEYLVSDPTDGLGAVVTGQYCPSKHSVDWLIGVANHQLDKPFPGWPMRFDPDGDCNALVIEAPEGVVVRCLTREHNESSSPHHNEK